MIPKIIHYCWFGKGEKSPLITKCIESWKRYCPDYKIIEWNEENFDININRFAKEAYECRKYAFVSDFVRLYVLYEFGGVYVDTDLELRKNIDDFLHNRAFSSFESKDYILTAIMGAEKGHPWIKELLDYYEDRAFIQKDGNLDMTPNPIIITEISKRNYGLVLNNKDQILKEDLHIYPNYVLCVNTWHDKNYSIHHFNGSWVENKGSCEYELIKYKYNYNNIIRILEFIETKEKMNFPMNKYRNIYFFGAGKITKYLIDYFNIMGIEINGIITRESKDSFYGLRNINIDNIKETNSEDLIIVVPSYDFIPICNEIAKSSSSELISIEQILC